MRTRSIALATPIFLIALIIQESLLNQVRLPASGFTFFLVFTFIWSALSSPEIGGITGFSAGLLLDLSQYSNAPLGTWTLILSLVGYAVAFLGYGDEQIHSNAFSVVVLTVSAVAIAQISYVILSALLGRNIGSILAVLGTIVGTAIWNLLISPIIFPLTRFLHDVTYESAGRI